VEHSEEQAKIIHSLMSPDEESSLLADARDDYKSASEKEGNFYISQEECLALETKKYDPGDDEDPFEDDSPLAATSSPAESNYEELPHEESSDLTDGVHLDDEQEESSESGTTMLTVQSAGEPAQNNFAKPWAFRQLRAYNETRKEWDLFKYYCGCGESRSITHVAQLFGLRPASVLAISKKNNWALRSEAYDKFVLAKALRSEEKTRQAEHIRKLEVFRQQQEFLGASMTSSAAKIMHLAQRRLDNMLSKDGAMISEAQLSQLLSVATKIAETGKALTGTALGVDALLEAVESNEGEDYG
jgi:hypothetical protein